jgi:hypothetical protein
MTVLWQLDSYETCTIRWGLSTDCSSGSAKVAPYGDMQYQYTISGLLSGTLYYYQVEGVGIGSFRSAPEGSPRASGFWHRAILKDRRRGMTQPAA